MVFVGILGTIMGFYYGADSLSKEQIRNIADVVQKLAGSQNLEETALSLLLKKNFEGAEKAFDDAFNATPALPNIGNIDGIRKVLAGHKTELVNAGNEAEREAIWKIIFCEISGKGLTTGMTDEMKKTVDGYCNPPPLPSPTPSPTAAPPTS